MLPNPTAEPTVAAIAPMRELKLALLVICLVVDVICGLAISIRNHLARIGYKIPKIFAKLLIISLKIKF